jgi:hypothetical protein
MLYLRNTNQVQTLAQAIERGTSENPPLPPVTGSYFDGLGRTQYQPGFGGGGAPAFTPASFTGSQYQIGTAQLDSGSLQPTFLTSGSINTGSAQWLGYFLPSTTETYTFYLDLDDRAIWWFGNEATASLPLSSSAVVNSNFAPPYVVRSGSIALTSGSYVPVKIQYTGVSAPDYFTASFSTPTITKTSDFTNYTFCNTASLGF